MLVWYAHQAAVALTKLSGSRIIAGTPLRAAAEMTAGIADGHRRSSSIRTRPVQVAADARQLLDSIAASLVHAARSHGLERQRTRARPSNEFEELGFLGPAPCRG